MGTLIRDNEQRNPESQTRWERFERAERFEQYQELRTQGVSQRQAAKELKVPRTTLQAWQVYQDDLDEHPAVVTFFQSSPGLAFLHRLVLGLHLLMTEVGACGIRLVCLLLKLTGLDRFVAASYGAQQQVNRQVEEAIADYRQTETARLAKDMPHKDITLTQDETFTGGLSLVGSDPVSNFIILEQLAGARDQTTWNDLMAPALAQLNCTVIQSTSDEGSGILAYVEHHLGAHHSPDLFHVQQELVKAVSGPLATKQRAAIKATSEAQQRLEKVQGPLQDSADELPLPGPTHSPTDTSRLEQGALEAQVASQELERISAQREQVAQSIRTISKAYHFVDLERGVRRNAPLIAADIQAQVDQVRAVAQHEGLSQSSLDRIDKAQRVVPKMQATIAFVSGYVTQQVSQLDLSLPVSYAMHAQLIPSYYLNRVRARWGLSRHQGRPRQGSAPLPVVGGQDQMPLSSRLSFVGLHLFVLWLEQQQALDPVVSGLQQATQAYQQAHRDEEFALLHHCEQTLLRRFQALLLAPLLGIERLTEFDTHEHPLPTLIGRGYQSSTLNQFLGQLERVDAAKTLMPALQPAQASQYTYIDGHMIAYWARTPMHKGKITMLGRIMAGSQAVIAHNEVGHAVFVEYHPPDILSGQNIHAALRW